MTDIVFSAESIASLVIMAALGIGIPVAAALVWRFALHKGTMKATFIGAGMFFLFAIILERLLHMVMVPVVSGNVVLYVVYGAVAAGVFEETARFLSFRFLMKNSRSAENAVSYGLGHGAVPSRADRVERPDDGGFSEFDGSRRVYKQCFRRQRRCSAAAHGAACGLCAV